jgi:hypothetical protein
MEETLRQLHLERLARRQPEVFIPHIPPPPTDAELEARRQVAEESKVEEKMEETKEEEEVEEESCSVCLCPMETKHTLQCGHEICGDCPAMMKAQNLGNGCVGLHSEAGIKVIKCPICRKEDMPTREELIAEIVRIRRSGRFTPLAPPRLQNPAPRVHHPIVRHNLPEVIPVLQPVIQHNQPPAPAPVAIQDGNWLRNQNFRPRRGENQDRNHLPHFCGVFYSMPVDIARWNILRGHTPEDANAVGQFLNGGQRVGHGWICGVAGTRRFYHRQYFIPELTENTAPARRNCNNEQCQGNHRSRTARRCPRGCGQFICQACDGCNYNVCQPLN